MSDPPSKAHCDDKYASGVQVIIVPQCRQITSSVSLEETAHTSSKSPWRWLHFNLRKDIYPYCTRTFVSADLASAGACRWQCTAANQQRTPCCGPACSRARMPLIPRDGNSWDGQALHAGMHDGVDAEVTALMLPRKQNAICLRHTPWSLIIGQIGAMLWDGFSRGYMHAAAHTALCHGHDALTGQVLMLCRGSGRRQMPRRSPLPAIPSHGTGSGGQLSASCRKRSLAYMATSKIWCVVVHCKIPPNEDIGQLCLFGRVVWSCPYSCALWHIA
jgi:hypothetical protein